MRGILRDMLRDCGATQIELASSGKEAIHRLESGNYDVVLCDFNLTTGRNGQQLLEEAKVRKLIGPTCIWIMVSAEKSPEWIMGTAEYQPDAYLIKPINTGLLQDRLEKIDAKKQALGEVNDAMLKKQFAKAVQLVDQQLTWDKANIAELFRLKALALLQGGELEAARKLFEQVLSSREMAWARSGLAQVAFQQGDFKLAAEHFQRCIDGNRLFLEAYDGLAKSLQLQGQAEQAEEVLASALKLSPNVPQRQSNLGELAFARGDMDTADRAFRKSIAVSEHSIMRTPNAFLGLAKTCSATERGDEALVLLNTVQKQFDTPEVRLRAKAVQGVIYQKANQADKAAQMADEVIRLAADLGDQLDEQASLDAAQLLLATDRKDDAVALLQKLVMNNHENAAILAGVQAVFDAAGMQEEGASLVEGSRKEVTDMMNKGVLLARAGKLDEALDAMRSARTRMASNSRVLVNFAHVAILKLQQAGKQADLVAECRDALKAANRIAPGDKRCIQLIQTLAEIERGAST
jgi:tetratricopeptide (TPR) repeat protein